LEVDIQFLISSKVGDYIGNFSCFTTDWMSKSRETTYKKCCFYYDKKHITLNYNNIFRSQKMTPIYILSYSGLIRLMKVDGRERKS